MSETVGEYSTTEEVRAQVDASGNVTIHVRGNGDMGEISRHNAARLALQLATILGADSGNVRALRLELDNIGLRSQLAEQKALYERRIVELEQQAERDQVAYQRLADRHGEAYKSVEAALRAFGSWPE